MRRSKRHAFVLLEVILAMTILAVVMAAVLRGFILSIDRMRDLRVIAVASTLAETLLDDYEIEPPVAGRVDGRFADDKRFGAEFAEYRWEREVRTVDVRYSTRIPRNLLQDPEPLQELKLRVIYEAENRGRFVPVEITTYLMETQLFTDEAIQTNQLF